MHNTSRSTRLSAEGGGKFTRVHVHSPNHKFDHRRRAPSNRPHGPLSRHRIIRFRGLLLRHDTKITSLHLRARRTRFTRVLIFVILLYNRNACSIYTQQNTYNTYRVNFRHLHSVSNSQRRVNSIDFFYVFIFS